MIIIVQGPPASGKTTVAQAISKKFSLPHISRDIIKEWMSVVDEEKDKKIQSFCCHAGYELMFDLAGELSKGEGSFIVEGCINPESGPSRMLDKLGDHNHEIIEVFLTAKDEVLVNRYLARAGSKSRHEAHASESERGDELAKHLKECIYRPMKIGERTLEFDNSVDPETIKNDILDRLSNFIQLKG